MDTVILSIGIVWIIVNFMLNLCLLYKYAAQPQDFIRRWKVIRVIFVSVISIIINACFVVAQLYYNSWSNTDGCRILLWGVISMYPFWLIITFSSPLVSMIWIDFMSTLLISDISGVGLSDKRMVEIRNGTKKAFFYVFILCFLILIVHVCFAVGLDSLDANLVIQNDVSCVVELSPGMISLLSLIFVEFLLFQCGVLFRLYSCIPNKDLSEGSPSMRFIGQSVQHLFWFVIVYSILILAFIILWVSAAQTYFRNTVGGFSPFWLGLLIPMMLSALIELFIAFSNQPRRSKTRGSLDISFSLKSFVSNNSSKNSLVVPFDKDLPPIPLEHQKSCAENLDYVMNHPYLRDEIKKFSIMEHSVENILFYEDWKEAENIYQNGFLFLEVLQKLETLYKTYIVEDAPLELNLTQQKKNQLRNMRRQSQFMVEKVDILIQEFKSVFGEVESLILLNTFPRFINWYNQKFIDF